MLPSMLLDDFIRSLSDPALLLGSDGDTIVAANDALVALVRRSEAELRGLSWTAQVDAEMVELHRRRLLDARTSRKKVVAESVEPASSALAGRILEHRYTPILGVSDVVEGFAWISRDVTIERRAVADLARSEMRLKDAQRVAHIGSWEFDIVGNVLTWSDEIFRMFRIDPRRFGASYEAFLAAIHPEDRAAVDARYRGSLETRTSYEIRHRLLFAGGEVRWVDERCESEFDEAGKPLLSRGTVQDVTDLVLAEKRQQESDVLFRALLDALPDAVLTVVDGRFAYANRAAVAMLGYQHTNELVGLGLTAVVAVEDLPNVRQMVRAELPISGNEVRWLRRDGTKVVVDVSAIQSHLDGQPTRVVVARDVSARKELAERIARVERLISVGTLAAGVGHEINNPLAFVVGNLEFIAERLPRVTAGSVNVIVDAARADELQVALGEARQGTERVQNIVRELRAFSGQASPERRSVDVRALIDSALTMSASQLRHRAKLVKEYGPVPRVDADGPSLSQVFLNLIVNAAQAPPEGQADDHSVRLVTRTDSDGRVVVEISDTGCGIPGVVLARIFDPFFTTKPVGVGMGLGLSICQNIVHGLGGDISVESRERKGTTFRVTLPASRAALTFESPDSPPRAIAPSLRPSGTIGRARVLVVDDEDAIGRMFARIMGQEHDVITTTRGADLLTRLALGERFDIIFSDLMMPGLSGMDLHREVEKRFPEQAARMVFISGGAFTLEAQAFLERTGVRRLEKPFGLKDIRAILRESLDAA